MNEKKQNLIEVGLSLFAEKGYHATSIQEIAAKAGISKGAFYLYFQSKEDFITTAFQSIHQMISDQLEKTKGDNPPTRQTLANQIDILMQYIYTYKGFIMMHIRESISIGEKMDFLIKKMKVQNFHWMQENIDSIYGQDAKEFTMDIIIQFEGLLNGYFKWMVMDDIELNTKQVGKFLVRRLDDLVNGMTNSKEEPLITMEHVAFLFEAETQDKTKIMHALSEKISALPIKKEQISRLDEVLEALTTEINKTKPQLVLLQGLLAHFQRYPVLQEECEQLATIFNIDLLEK